MAQVELFKRKGKYTDKKTGEEKPFLPRQKQSDITQGNNENKDKKEA